MNLYYLNNIVSTWGTFFSGISSFVLVFYTIHHDRQLRRRISMTKRIPPKIGCGYSYYDASPEKSTFDVDIHNRSSIPRSFMFVGILPNDKYFLEDPENHVIDLPRSYHKYCLFNTVHAGCVFRLNLRIDFFIGALFYNSGEINKSNDIRCADYIRKCLLNHENMKFYFTFIDFHKVVYETPLVLDVNDGAYKRINSLVTYFEARKYGLLKNGSENGIKGKYC